MTDIMTNRVKPFPRLPRTTEFVQMPWPHSRGWAASYATAGYGHVRVFNPVWDLVWTRGAMQMQRKLQTHD